MNSTFVRRLGSGVLVLIMSTKNTNKRFLRSHVTATIALTATSTGTAAVAATAVTSTSTSFISASPRRPPTPITPITPITTTSSSLSLINPESSTNPAIHSDDDSTRNKKRRKVNNNNNNNNKRDNHTSTSSPPPSSTSNSSSTNTTFFFVSSSSSSSSSFSIHDQDHNNMTLPPHLCDNPYFQTRQILIIPVHGKDFSLSQAVCSYGYFCLAPNRWVPANSSTSTSTSTSSAVPATDTTTVHVDSDNNDDQGYLVRPLRYGPQHQYAILVAIGQHEQQLYVAIQDTQEQQQKEAIQQQQQQQQQQLHSDLLRQIHRMLRLDADMVSSLTNFHRVYPEAKRRRFGRLYRSPTLFEDIVKTITNCNMQWSGTVDMNAKLCRNVPKHNNSNNNNNNNNIGAFPTPHEIQQYTTPAYLKEHCRLGYRSEWIWDLANDIVEGRLDLEELESMATTTTTTTRTSRTDLQKRLKQIKGIGEFASNNILQLMGYFDTFPYDTETVRLWKEEFLSTKSSTTATAASPSLLSKQEIFKMAKKHYDKHYEPCQFMAYWFDLWRNYESRAGDRSPQWRIEQLESHRPPGVTSDHNQVFVNENKKKNKKKKMSSTLSSKKKNSTKKGGTIKKQTKD